MRYPIINGELPPMAAIVEYHIVTATGNVSCTFDDRELAEKRFKQLNNPTWKLVEVRRTLHEITPISTKSDIVCNIAKERGIPLIDVPLSIVA